MLLQIPLPFIVARRNIWNGSGQRVQKTFKKCQAYTKDSPKGLRGFGEFLKCSPNVFRSKISLQKL